MKLTPRGSRVLIEHRPQERKTAGGVYLPVTTEPQGSPTEYGTVLAVGPEVEGIIPGQSVLFHRHAGVSIEDGDKKLQLLLEESILALVGDVA